MKQSELDTQAARLYATLVTFAWGSSVERYAAYTDSLEYAPDYLPSVTWEALPALKIEFSKQHGGVEDAPISITMPASKEPATGLVNGYPHADVSVLVGECDPSDVAGTLRPVFSGFVSEATLNALGQEEVVTLRVAGIKDKLFLPSGIAVTNTCPWIFGDANCKVDVEALKVSATVNAISGFVVTLSVTGPSSRYYHRGYIERGGARIMIREYTTGNDYTLVRPPHPDWLNQTVELAPGCDKTSGVCNTRWSNLQNFAGAGLGIPGYNPVIELPS